MTLNEILAALEALGSERTKKIYMGQGAVEPVFGVATGAMKPLVKTLKFNQPMAEALYATGNYDAMYLAGMIADPKLMTPKDFHRWMESAYCHMISNFIVSVTLAEAPCAEEVADQFIASGEDLKMAAGWSCYEWLLGWKKDEALSAERIQELLTLASENYEESPVQTKKAMLGFVIAVAISFKALSDKAVETAERLSPTAYDKIQRELSKGRLGFKRKNVRC